MHHLPSSVFDFAFTLFYFGGFIPAYRHSRKNGAGWISRIIDAVLWPVDVAWVIADKYCDTVKR